MFGPIPSCLGLLGVEDSVVAMVSELRSKELQRNQMQLQVEHDKQMTLGFRRTLCLAKKV